MYVARASTKLPLSKQTAAQLSKAVANFSHSYGCSSSTPGLHLTGLHAPMSQPRRTFSSTSRASLRDYFPEAEHHDQIQKTEAAWPHPKYNAEEMKKNIYFAHREPADFSDRVALGMVRLLRWGTDLATGYKHDVEEPKAVGDKNAVSATKPYRMNERKWLVRMVFLESVAGPGWFMRFMILGAQGVFFNSMFLSYLISPRTCHRFVGYLEEEAVLTYTLAIQDIEAGKLPKWSDPSFRVPDLAVNYWKMPEGARTMRDLLLYIRADEAKHREVNHTLGNLKQQEDPNPFVSSYKEDGKPHPGKGIENIKPLGWERKDVI
ncbi:Alternative oxidase [Lachnellula suecica]|uniref:Alternative oxidase n=1 Tax=Lachnellula suecica TaxID=602035 RepID=A0A8T9CCP5_9HELO|nr:Alternative oxidase [Lachnellula suecica]